jgi:hypothetical protein
MAVWKVPRQCPPVLLVKARLVLGISSILILKMLERLIAAVPCYIASAQTAQKTPFPAVLLLLLYMATFGNVWRTPFL